MPAIVEANNELDIVQEETFAPILYLIKSTVRLLLFQSIGKHFSAGADLGWMK